MDLDYQKILKELNDLGVDHLVVGGLAVNFHGVPRMTYDIDLMILLQSDNILKLVSRLKLWDYKAKVPVDPRDLADEVKRNTWIRDKGVKALPFYSETLPIVEIDLVLESPISYRELKKRLIKVELKGEMVPTVSIHDLIELKLKVGRRQDVADVEH